MDAVKTTAQRAICVLTKHLGATGFSRLKTEVRAEARRRGQIQLHISKDVIFTTSALPRDHLFH